MAEPSGLPPDLIRAVGASREVVVLTGSGVSAESGVPTFREAQTGLWERHDPQDLATPEAFARDPDLVWSWYVWRRALVEAAEPNAGHRALARWERGPGNFTLVTQNVDGLHQRAGSRNVLELHGSILRSVCSAERLPVEPVAPAEGVPACPNCGAPLRPDVVWFGETLPAEALEAARAAAGACDLFLSVGTSGLVHPAAGLAHEALAGGATVVEINPGETPLTPVAHHALRDRAARALPRLVDALQT